MILPLFGVDHAKASGEPTQATREHRLAWFQQKGADFNTLANSRVETIFAQTCSIRGYDH